MTLEILNVGDDRSIVFYLRQKQASPGRDTNFGLLSAFAIRLTLMFGGLTDYRR